MGQREIEVEHHGEGRQPEREVKIKIEVSSKNFAHYECHIRTTGTPEDINQVDDLFDEAMRLMQKLDLAMAARNAETLE